MKLSFPYLAGLLSLGLVPMQAHARDQASMTTLMKELTPQYVLKLAGKDDELKLLLLNTFEADWSKAKECLLFEKWPQSEGEGSAARCRAETHGRAGADALGDLQRGGDDNSDGH